MPYRCISTYGSAGVDRQQYETVCHLTYDYILSHCRHLGRDCDVICLCAVSVSEDT